MAAGIQIIGDHGAVQIDSGYSNFGFVQAGTVMLTLDPVTHPNPMYIGSITYTGQTPLLALACADQPINVERVVKSGTTHTFHIKTQSYAPLTVSYWIYDTAAVSLGASAPEFIEINDQYGNLVFHGGMRPLNVVDFIQIDAPPDAWTGMSWEGACHETRTLTPGRTFAVIQSSLCHRPETWKVDGEYPLTPDPGYDFYNHRNMHSASKVVGHVVDVGLETFESGTYQHPSSQPNTAWTRGSLNWLIVDVTGVGTAPSTSDFTPNAIDWPNVSLSTTSHTGSQVGTSRTLSGITSSIGLRVEVSGYSGNLATGSLTLLRNGSSAGSVNLLTGGYFDATVSNGDALAFQVSGTTTAGSKSGSASITVKNLSTGGSTLDTFTASASVDTDNNYNTTDVTPDGVNWPNLSASSNSNTVGVGAGFYQTFTGINTPITVRVTVSAVSGNLSGGGLTCYKRTGTDTAYGTIPLTNGSYLDATFVDGNGLGFTADGSTTSGIRSGSWTVTVTNVTTGATLDAFTVNLTADADNNYNNADYTPNAVNWTNQSASSNDYQVYAGVGSDKYLTGFNTPITVRVSISGVSGNLINRLVSVYVGGSFTANISASNGTYQDFTINPDTHLGFITFGETAAGIKSGGWTVTVTNVTTGSVIDTFTTSLTADADNNYNTTDYTPDAVNWPNHYDFASSTEAQDGAGYYAYISGINAPITVRVRAYSLSNSGMTYAGFDVYRHGTYMGTLNPMTGSPYIDITVTNGQGLGWISYAGAPPETFTGATKYARWYVSVTNQTTGQTLDTIYVDLNANPYL